MESQSLNWLARFVATKTGLSSVAITTAISIAAPIITHVVTHKSAYDEGQRDYEAALINGTAQLDGKIIAIIDQDQKQADTDSAYLRGQVDGYNDAQSQFKKTLESINESHANAITAIGQRNFTPAENAWRSVDVPESTRLRLNRLTSTRGTDHRQRGLSDSDYQSSLVDSSADNARYTYPQ